MVAIENELAERPLLKSILVVESTDSELLEALLLVNVACDVLKHQVQCFGRGAGEKIVNADFSDRLNFLLNTPLIKQACNVLGVSMVHLDPVELDGACLNILGSWRREGSLVGQSEEGLAIDEKLEVATLNIVVEGQLPLENVVLHLQREKAGVGEFFTTDQEQN